MSSNLLTRPRTSADSQFVFAGPHLNHSTMISEDKKKALRAARASRDSCYGNSNNNFTTNISSHHVSIKLTNLRYYILPS